MWVLIGLVALALGLILFGALRFDSVGFYVLFFAGLVGIIVAIVTRGRRTPSDPVGS